MKKLIWVIVVVVILVLGVVGYGFYGGFKTKNFATNSEKTFNASQTKWKVSDLANPPADTESDTTKLKAHFQKILDDCNSATSTINNLGKTSKGKTAKTNLIRYYALGKKSSENALVFVDYMAEMQKIEKDLSFNPTGTTPDSLAKDLQTFKTTVDADLSTLKSIKTTPSTKILNDAFIKVLTDLSGYIGPAITAVNSGDINAMASMSTNMGKTMSTFEQTKLPTETEMQNDIITKSEQDEMNSLASKIPSELTGLKKTIFAY